MLEIKKEAYEKAEANEMVEAETTAPVETSDDNSDDLRPIN